MGKAKYVRYRTFCGTPNEMEHGEHETEAPAKGWLLTRLRARKKWAERYCWDVRDQLGPIMEAVGGVNLRDAKVGREWRWEAVDPVSKVHFVYEIKVVA